MTINLGNSYPQTSRLTSQEYLVQNELPANLHNIGNYILFCCGEITEEELRKTTISYPFISEEQVAA